MNEGLLKTNAKFTTKLPYDSVKKIALKLETPLPIRSQTLGEITIPGSQYITKPFQKVEKNTTRVESIR